jgi:DNA-binding NtrC family response regulator
MGKTILVVDDEAGYRDLLSLELGACGFKLLTACDGVQALETIGSTHVDLVITDIRMPHMNGIDVLRAVKSSFPDMPVILMTGYSVEDRAEAARSEACAFLRKPFEMSELKTVVQAAF